MRNKSRKIISATIAILILLNINFQTLSFAEKDYWMKEVNSISDKYAELTALVSVCEEKGMAVDYEKIDLYLIKKFTEHIYEDINKLESGGENIVNRISGTVEELNLLCDKTKNSLNNYLDGRDTPKEVVYPDSSGIFNVGYLTGDINSNFENLKKMGSNYSMMTVAMRDVIKEADAVSGFSIMKSLNGKNISYKRSPKGSNNYKLTISAQNVQTGDDYIYQNVSLEPNTEYEFGGEISADVKYSGYITLRKTEAVGEKIDINKIGTNIYTKTFVTDSSGNMYQFRMGLNSENQTGISFDNVFVRKMGSTKNLLINSGFENCVTEYQTEYGKGGIDYEVLNQYKSIFESAEENGINLGIMLNLQEYPAFLQERNSEYIKKFSPYIPYNITEDSVRGDIAVFVKTISENFKQYSSIENICLLNEPEYDTRLAPEYYQKLWEEYLEKKHGNVGSMNNSYGGTSYTSFSEVEMPADKSWGGVFYDWKCFNEDVLVDYMRFLRNCVKSVSDIPVCFKVMISNGITDTDEFVQNGNTALEKFGKVSDYFGCDAYATYTKKQPLLGKTMVYDVAYSISGLPIINSEDHVISDWINYKDTEKYYDRLNSQFIGADIWMGALHQRKSTALWTLRTSDVESHYAYNSLGERPGILSEIGERALDVARLEGEVKAFFNRESGVAIIYSDASRSYRREYINAMYNVYCALRYAGRKVKFVTEEQIKENSEELKKYKLVVVASVQHTLDSTAEAVREYSRNGGRLMIFDRQSLMRDEYGVFSNERNSVIDEIYNSLNTTTHDISFENYKMTEDISEEIYNTVSELYDDTYTISDIIGNRVNVAYDVTSHNGYTLINLYNTTSENVNLNISEDGININEMYDALNDKEIKNGVVKLEPYGVALIKTEREPIKVIGNLSEKSMIIKGYSHIPNALVSAFVVKKGTKEEKLPKVDDILYMNEKRCNDSGDFSFNVTLSELMGSEYQVYVRVKGEDKISKTYQYEFFVPRITITCDGKTIADMSQLSEGDVIDINLEVINEDKIDFSGVLHCALYENGFLKNSAGYKVDGDKTQKQSVVENYTIGKTGKNSVLKIMFWDRNNIKPYVSAYVIE